MKKKIGKISLSLILTLLFTIILIEILKKIGFFSILEVLKQTNWLYFSLATIIFFSSYIIWAIKWKILINFLEKINIENIVLTLLASSFAYVTTPGPRFGGEPVRTYYISKLTKKSKTEILATVLFERSTESIGINFLFIFSYIVILITRDISSNIIKILTFTTFILLIWIIIRTRFIKEPNDLTQNKIISGILLFIYKISKKLKKNFHYFPSFKMYMHEKIKKYSSLYFKFNNDKDIFNKQIIYGVIKWTLINLSVFTLFISTGTQVNLIHVLIVQTIAFVISSFTFIPGGIGIFESVMIGLYFAFGINISVAATVALLYRAINYFFSLFIGLICIIILNRRIRPKQKKKKIIIFPEDIK